MLWARREWERGVYASHRKKREATMRWESCSTDKKTRRQREVEIETRREGENLIEMNGRYGNRVKRHKDKR